MPSSRETTRRFSYSSGKRIGSLSIKTQSRMLDPHLSLQRSCSVSWQNAVRKTRHLQAVTLLIQISTTHCSPSNSSPSSSAPTPKQCPRMTPTSLHGLINSSNTKIVQNMITLNLSLNGSWIGVFRRGEVSSWNFKLRLSESGIVST